MARNLVDQSHFMERALSLGWKAFGTTSPNPPVGAVVVKNGVVVGEGFTQPPGLPHAEVVAMGRAGESVRGAILYTSLEPCSHFGRTPPCTAAIISAGITEVHFALSDPNPIIKYQGRLILEKAGVTVVEGEEQEKAGRLYAPYQKFVAEGRPFVTAKFAMSMDGRIATVDGESRWISGEMSRRRVQTMRRLNDAVLVGIGTALQDDPLLTARRQDGGLQKRQPLRVLVDSQGRLHLTARLLQERSPLLVVASRETEGVTSLRTAGFEVVICPEEKSSRVNLLDMLKILAKRGVVTVLAEGGGELLGSLFDAGLVDKVIAFVAPMIIGGKGAPSPVEGRGVEHLSLALGLSRFQISRVGKDIVLVGYVER